MSISHAQQISLSCPVCRARFTAEAWDIVAGAERPDLVERVRAGVLHQAPCPNCGHAEELAAPLLLFHPDAELPIIVSPAPHADGAQGRQQAREIVALLRERLGDAWRRDWVARSFLEARREALPVLLTGTFAASVARVLNQMVQARSSAEVYRLVQAHPELLTDAVLNGFDQAIAAAQASDSAGLVVFYRGHRELLGRCRAIGVDAAFAEYVSAPAESLRVPPPDAALPPEVRPILAQIDQSADDHDTRRRADLCRQALALLSDTEHPHLWAALSSELGSALAQDRSVERAANLEAAIVAYEQALTVRTRSTAPRAWAKTMMNLANAYSDRIAGERAMNLETAIAAYEQILTVLTREATPTEWAQAMGNLALAYDKRIAGERAANLEVAIAAYEQVLTVLTREATPTEWATATVNLANAYIERLCGDRAANIEVAITAYERALTVHTRESMPTKWAQTTNNLAVAYYFRVRGDRAANLEIAIAAHERVLTVRIRETMPAEWAITMMNLGIAYAERLCGERAANVEAAIAAYEQALVVLTREATPIDWAQTLHNRGLANFLRIMGERAMNLEAAIACYEQALTVRTREALPVAWAQTTTNLANAYVERLRGDRAANLEAAIACYEQALSVQTHEAMPIEWAATTMNLANAYVKHLRGDRAANLEAAIACYEQALTVRTRDALPIEWATTMLNLAIARQVRIAGDQATNIEMSIDAYQQALTVLAREALPFEWATVMVNLGIAYYRRLRSDRAANLEAAIACYEQALTVLTREGAPIKWAQTTNNLALAFANRIRGVPAENLEAAIVGHEQALTVLTREASPIEWAQTTANLANAYAERLQGDRAANLEVAIASYEQALTVLQPELLPDDSRRVARALGEVYAEIGRWHAARDSYAKALQAAESRYVLSVSLLGKESELSTNGDLFRRAAYAFARSDNIHETVVMLERGRARIIGEALNRDRANLHALSQSHPDLAQHYRVAAADVRQFEHVERADGPNISAASGTAHPAVDAATFTVLAGRARAARIELDAATVTIRAVAGYESFLRPPNYTEIAAAARPGLPLVYLTVTPQGSLILIVSAEAAEPEVLLLDNFKEADLDTLLIKRENGEVIGGYIPGQINDRTKLITALTEELPLLGAALIGPLAARLRDLHATGVILIPTGLLSLLPLHAASYEVDGQIRCLLDEFDVAYAPSARVLTTARRELQQRANGALRLAGVGNPTSDLRFAGLELQSIADLFPADDAMAFYRADATRAAILDALPDSNIGHFSCHGAFAADPLDSALLLAQSTQLTLRELVTSDASVFVTLRLVVLSACKTAMTDFQRVPDESIGLPGGFLQAGVPAVVGTLWSVNDLSTALLMFRFYELHMQGDPTTGLAPQSPARALRLAQRWLRDLTYWGLDTYYKQNQQMGTAMKLAIRELNIKHMPPDDRPYADPIYWAAFTFNGAAEV